MTFLQWLLVVLGSTLVVLVALVRIGRSKMAKGRLARLLHISALSARISTSWLGAKIRRVFAGTAGRARIDEQQRLDSAKRVAETMGHMKGAFMKLGQMVSFVTDDVPEAYRQALASLQTSAPPMDFALLRDVAERELGRPLERAFARFDPVPLASASIGQVHRAQLPDGREVVVKIQYPGVAEAIGSDLQNAEVLTRLAMMMFPNVDAGPVVDELRARITEELDYAREANNQLAFLELYRGHPFIRVPEIIPDYCTARVLTSEYVAGRRWNDVIDPSVPVETRDRYGEILYRFVFGSISQYGVFNGDPHPGNYLFDDDGKIVFIDFGCVKYFPKGMRQNWTAVVVAHLSGDRDRFRELIVALGFLKADTPISAELIYEYFCYFYEPFRLDRTFTFTREYNKQSFGMVFRPDGRFAGFHTQLNMPPDFVFANRIQWGVVSLLAQLGATANWHHIHKEFLMHGPPSTPLGLEDAAFRAAWRAERGFGDEELSLTPDGIRRFASLAG
jgi:predicted unusual protein kinase regulating ubiquinone biosynthesis (AarF/ABC1/UbiB family)